MLLQCTLVLTMSLVYTCRDVLLEYPSVITPVYTHNVQQERLASCSGKSCVTNYYLSSYWIYPFAKLVLANIL